MLNAIHKQGDQRNSATSIIRHGSEATFAILGKVLVEDTVYNYTCMCTVTYSIIAIH